mgnify:FL=1
MFRTILAVLFAVCYLILGIPVLFVEWLIGKKEPASARYQQSADGTVGISGHLPDLWR